MNLYTILYFLFTSKIIKAFYTSDYDNITNRVLINGELENNIIVYEYEFIHRISYGIHLGFCDTVWLGNERCDPIITRTSCTIKPNCYDTLIKRIPLSVLKYYECKSSYDAIRNPLSEWTDISYCQTLFLKRPAGTDSERLSHKHKFLLKHYYKWHFQTSTLFDDDYGKDYHDVYVCVHDLKNDFVFGVDYDEVKLYTDYHNFIYQTSMLSIKSVFTCSPNYNNPFCTVTCKDDHRRKCVQEYIFKDLPTYEQCFKGWILIRYKTHFYIPKCGLTNEKMVLEVTYWRCLYLDMCSLKPNLCTGYGNYCVISGNSTYICAHAKPHFRSNLYPTIINATHLHVLVGERITCELYKENLNADLYAMSTAIWYHYNNITVPTPTKNQRNRKNYYLTFENNFVIFNYPKLGFGYDFTLISKLSLAYGYIVVDLIMNYTAIEIPSEIYVPDKFYFVFNEDISFESDGFPKNLITYDFIINNDAILTNSKLKSILIPAGTYFGMVKINITCNLDPPDYVYYGFWRQYFQSIKVFRSFNWRSTRFFFFDKDILYCDVQILTTYKMKIIQLYGETIVDSTDDTKILIENYKRGIYKFMCILLFDDYNTTFFTINQFEIHIRFSELCFLPFAPMRGMLVKCVTDHYPVKQGVFKILFQKLPTKDIILETNFEWIRIPYDISINHNYLIACEYRYILKNENASHMIDKLITLKDGPVIQATQTKASCLEYSDLPQEYNYNYDSKFKILFYNQMYFLVQNADNSDSFCLILLLVSFVFQFPIFPIQLWLRKRTTKENYNQLIRHVEFGNKRNIIRRLNERTEQKIFMKNGIDEEKFNLKFEHLFIQSQSR